MKDENEAHAPDPMQVRKEKLLAFSYLFVPLLFLGMKGEKKSERKRERETTKKLVTDMLTVKSLIPTGHKNSRGRAPG